ncbi:hypothetical protein ACOMHN_015655 [Nucella lapillus]
MDNRQYLLVDGSYCCGYVFTTSNTNPSSPPTSPPPWMNFNASFSASFYSPSSSSSPFLPQQRLDTWLACSDDEASSSSQNVSIFNATTEWETSYENFTFYDLSQKNISLLWRSREELLKEHLGDRHISLVAVVLLTMLYTLIFLSGVLGNVCTCVVISRNRSMHTATNYYLFSLAVSDVLTLLLEGF